MNRMIVIVIVIAGILVVSEILYWLAVSPSTSSPSDSPQIINGELRFYFQSYGNRVRILDISNISIIRDVVKNYYSDDIGVVAVIDRDQIDRLIELSLKHNFKVYILSIMMNPTYNVTQEIFLPYQNLSTDDFILLRGEFVYYGNRLFPRQNIPMSDSIVQISDVGEKELYLDSILSTETKAVFSFENRTKASRYNNSYISNTCYLNRTVDYKKDYVERVFIDRIVVKPDFNDTSTLYTDYPIKYCEDSYVVGDNVEGADRYEQVYRGIIRNDRGMRFLVDLKNVSLTYRFPVRYTLSGNIYLDYELE
ncbi:MAG: hypothetical protein NZ908_02750 [Candidatus Micrarchaeota archaeon]|nr:hypothetical protein [Candidatus Micrarchaeota archaeon]MCX8154764.1 hypothetical protein [Candidatus Micrarchaeota archaeon]